MTDSDDTARGADQTAPLVSVICRTTGRTELRQALASIVAQTYRPIEIVLVDAAGEGLDEYLPWCGNLNTFPVSTGERLLRSKAANEGLAAANGRFLMLLDEDDWIAPQHVANLVDVLNSKPDIRAAYASVQKTSPEGESLAETFAQDFDPVLLRRDNYIPIHAMLFDVSLVEAGCRFDESLEVYEDWDFWLQLSRLTDFEHQPGVSAFYRQGGLSNTAAVESAPRFNSTHLLGRSRIALYDKWMKIWSGSELNELVGSLDQSEDIRNRDSKIEELDSRLREQESQIADLDLRLNKITNHRDALKVSLDESLSRLTQTEDQLRHTRDHVKLLESELNRLYTSLSWRATGLFRRIARLIERFLIAPLKRLFNNR